MSKLIIDWSVLSYVNWHKMRAKDYTPKFSLELEEFASNMAEHILYLTTRFAADEIIFAIDPATNWRQDVYNQYYLYAVDYYKSTTNRHDWYALVDKILYRVHQDEQTEKWFVDKVADKDTPSGLDDPEQYLFFEGGKMPAEMLADHPEAPAHVTLHSDWDGLKLVVPEYKGSRKTSAWDYETPRHEFKIHTQKLAQNMADTIGAKCIGVDKAEADDIIARYCVLNKMDNIILVTNDSDLSQLLIPCLQLIIFNPANHSFVKKTRHNAQFELLCKLLGGDGSDNIAGVAPIGKKPFPKVDWMSDGSVKGGKTTVNFVRKLLDECGEDYDKVYEALDSTLDVLAWCRNLNLIFLGNIPDEVKASIDTEIKGASVRGKKYNLEEYGLSDREQMRITNSANRDKEKE